MSEQTDSPSRAPRWVTMLRPRSPGPFWPPACRLGFNGLITIRGRKSGLPRTTPLAIIEVSGRRWVWSPWGDVHWVRNLRAAGGATITVRGRAEEVIATELDAAQRDAFFRDVLGPVARAMPLGVRFIRIVDGVDLDDPPRGRRSSRLRAPSTVIQ